MSLIIKRPPVSSGTTVDDARPRHPLQPPAHREHGLTVPGYWDATESATYEVAGVGVVYLRGRDHGRLGMIVQEALPALKGCMSLFVKLNVPVDFLSPPGSIDSRQRSCGFLPPR